MYVHWHQAEGEAEFGRPQCWDKPSSLITHVVSMCTTGEQSNHSKKKNTTGSLQQTQLSSLDIQAKPDVLPLSHSPSRSLLFQPTPPPPLPPPSTSSPPLSCSHFFLLVFWPSFWSQLLSGRMCHYVALLSHGGDSLNQLHMCSALIGWPSAISPDLLACHRPLQWGSLQASHHPSQSSVTPPAGMISCCLSVFCQNGSYVSKENETKPLHFSFTELQ